jgi:tetratricopeptide (TPR) repeat protein
MEVGVLVLVCLSPWAFGSAGAEYESALYGGLALLLGLWAARILLERALSWTMCPVALVLAALLLGGFWQLVPLPHPLLSWLAPGTAQVYERLLPSQAEMLPFGETREAPVFAAGSTLSLYPGRTAQELMRLLAVFLLFVLVRNHIASPASFRRLAIVALVNGALLSLFGLIQFFTSPADTLYWTCPSAGSVFGPFVCRNHFAFYLNLCVGLGVGLLLVSRCHPSERTQVKRNLSASARLPKPGLGGHAALQQLTCTEASAWSEGARSLLQHPPTLWITVALALMISSVVVCASRGGIVALVSGAVLCLGINWLPLLRSRQLGAVLLTLVIVLALVSWFGFGRVEARLATLVGDEASKESRLSLWSRLLTLAKDYPVWGTGYGTFQSVEPLCRSDPADEQIYSNAENDYLEGLVEGGLMRLALSLLAIGLVFQLGYRAVRRPPHPALSPSGWEKGQGEEGGLTSGLALGALFGFLTLVVQSFVDFGLHIPAIAVLTTVLCAQLCALGGTSGNYRLRLWGVAPLAGTALAISLGLAFGLDGWRMYRAQQLRHAASSASNVSESGRYAHQVDYLARAARLAPENARLQVDLALAHYDQYRQQRRKLSTRDRLAGAVQVVADLAAVWPPMLGHHGVLTSELACLRLSKAREEFSKADEKQLVRKYLVPALRGFLQARDLCPILPEPQRCLADNAHKLEQADQRLIYLERAAFVLPYDPGLWYLCGDEVLDERPDQAWQYWQRSLSLSDLYLSLILESSAARLGPRELCAKVLPQNPKLFFAAALQLYPQPCAERQPFLEDALALFEKQSAPLTGKELHLKAVILCALDRSEGALACYRAALAQEPRRATWRFELARVLYQQKHLREAHRELQIVLSLQADHSDARELLTLVERKIAESM